MTPSQTNTDGRVGIEPRRDQRPVEPVAFEVERDVHHPPRVETFTCDHRGLARLRRRVVDLERRDRREGREAVRTRVEARSEQHDLVDLGCSTGDHVVDEARAGDCRRARSGSGDPVVGPRRGPTEARNPGAAREYPEPTSRERLGVRIGEEPPPGTPVGLERPHERDGFGGEAGPVLHGGPPGGRQKRERTFTLARPVPCISCRTGSRTRPAPTCASTPTTRSTGTRGARRRSPGPGAEDKPILLSVGYSACHWCHVMAHESFEDPAIAAVMNDLFVNVKVDREERPDVDAIYMQAVQAMTGSGGWPMTVFLDPDGSPVLRRHLLPARRPPGHARLRAPAGGGRRRVAHRPRRARPAGRAAASRRSRRAPRSAAGGAGAPTPAILDRAVASLSRSSSTPRFGGFGRAPKFPQAMTHHVPARPVAAGDRAARGARDGHGVARRDGRGRHLRPGRRRLPPLLGRRALARAPLREDALRPGPARRAPTCTAGW